jgi:hypothetical protein
MGLRTDQELARSLLETRKSGYSWRLILRKNWKGYAVLLAVCLVAFALVVLARADQYFWLVVGMYAGMVLRDLGWIRRISLAWPFNERVLDWDKVQRIADGELVT